MPKSKRKKRSKSKSGYFGVTKATSGKFQAMIWIKGKGKSLGSYKTAKQAANAFDKEAIKLRRPLSTLNYPKQAPVGYTPIQKPLQSNNTAGYRGVSKHGKNFRATTTINSKFASMGTFDTAKEAAISYDRAVLKSNQSTTLLNFPDMVHNLDVEPERKKYTLSSSGYRNVKKLTNGRFLARVTIDGKQKSVGTFDTAIQAALAYDQAAIKQGVKNSRLNFPKDQKKQKKQKKQVKKKKKEKQKKTKKKDLQAIQEYNEMLEIWNDME